DGLDGAHVFVQNGTVNANTEWYCSTNSAITFGTTNISFSQFTGTTYTADETSLHLSGTTFSVLSTWAGQTAITTLGAITTGTWHGSPLAAAYLPVLNGITAPTGAVNFNGQQATSLLIENRTSDPVSPATGQVWLRTDL